MWIDADLQLPEKVGFYFAVRGDSENRIAETMLFDGKFWVSVSEANIDDVSYWMKIPTIPLPKP